MFLAARFTKGGGSQCDQGSCPFNDNDLICVISAIRILALNLSSPKSPDECDGMKTVGGEQR